MSNSEQQSATYRCQDCGEVHDSTGICGECAGRVREYAPMDAPVYEVPVPGVGPIWFPADEYDGAYQYATGEQIEEGGDDAEGESDIQLVDFDGPVEVPVADV